MKSYFEIGGKIVECVLDGPTATGTPSSTRTKADKAMLKRAHQEFVSAVDQQIPGYDVKKGISGAKKGKAGTAMVRRGVSIAFVIAAADGPLPIGDAVAAAFLIGGGTYMIYSGTKDVIQR